MTSQLAIDYDSYIYSAGPLCFHTRARYPGTLPSAVLTNFKEQSNVQPCVPGGRLGAPGISPSQAMLPVEAEKGYPKQGLQGSHGKAGTSLGKMFSCEDGLLPSYNTYSLMCWELQCTSTEGSVPLGTGLCSKAPVRVLKGLAAPAGLESIVQMKLLFNSD